MPPEQNNSPPTAFIPSWLDDSDLTPYEFRVYCAILRRGNCFESVPKLARRIRMNRDTVWASLKSLEARGAVVKTSRRGHTTLFTALPIIVATQPSGNGGSAENKGHPSKPGDTQPLNSATTQRKTGGRHPAETEGYKGNPIEGSPIKSLPAKEPSAGILNWMEVYEEAARIGLPQWRAAEWLTEIGNKPVDGWRERLGLVFLKWELDGRREKPLTKTKANAKPN